MANSFFNDSNKAYSENLNDGILVGNAFDWTVEVSLPTDTDGVFPNSTTVVKAKVADVYATPNSNLSIGSSIENSSGSSQVYRLTVYPNFNRFGGFTFVSLEGDGSVIITEKGGTSPVRNNLDYSNLGNVTELKTLKEYDLVVTIPVGGEVTGLGFGFKSSSADVTASINQSNVTGLESDLSGIRDDLSSLESGKANKVHNHSSSDVKESSALSNIGTSANALQSVVNGAVNGKVGSLSTSISNNLTKINSLSREVWNNTSQTGTSRIDSLEGSVSSLSTSITNINTYTTYIDNENYTVKYNDYRVIIDVHLSSTTFPTTLTAFNENLIPSDCRPSQPVVVFLQNVNAIVSVRENSNGVYRKSITGSAIGSGGCYCHIEYSRV